MLAKYGRGSNLQFPITLKWYESKTSFEFIMRKNLPIPFDIVVITSSQAEHLKFIFFPSSAVILLVIWSANGDCSVFPRPVPQGQFTK